MYKLPNDPLNHVDPAFHQDAATHYGLKPITRRDQVYSVDDQIKVAWQIYVNAIRRPEKFLIAGRHSPYLFHHGASAQSLRDLVKQLGAPGTVDPIPVGIYMQRRDDDPESPIVIEYKTINEMSGHEGAILDSTKWTILANDAWILGGVNSGKNFTIVSPLSWYNLWTKTRYNSKKKRSENITWKTWYETRSPGGPMDQDGRMTVTAREMIGLHDTAGYQITRQGAHLITAKPVKQNACTLVQYLDSIKAYDRAGQTDYHALRTGLFKALPRNVTFHASPHLIVGDELTTVQQVVQDHQGKAGEPSLHEKLLQYDPQGPLLKQTNPDGSYSMNDLNAGLVEVFARSPDVAYTLDLRGANLSGVHPYLDPSSETADGDECFLIMTLTDLSGSVFTEREKINILFVLGVYNGADFSGASLDGLRGQIRDSNYDDTTIWPAGFPDQNDLDQMYNSYDPQARAFEIFDPPS
ncbi:MAG: hypothetical protein AAF557_06460 [Pseudomonadota bacterium]